MTRFPALPDDLVSRSLFLEVLRSFGEAKLAVNGTSMLPSIWPGDILEVRRPRDPENPAEVSEVVLFEREGRFFAHRVVEVEKVRRADGGDRYRTVLVTRGDRLRAPDPPVEAEELLGRVTCILRGGRRLAPRFGVWHRLVSWVLARSDLSTRVLLRVRALFVAPTSGAPTPSVGVLLAAPVSGVFQRPARKVPWAR
jgi:signal peptidase